MGGGSARGKNPMSAAAQAKRDFPCMEGGWEAEGASACYPRSWDARRPATRRVPPEEIVLNLCIGGGKTKTPLVLTGGSKYGD